MGDSLCSAWHLNRYSREAIPDTLLRWNRQIQEDTGQKEVHPGCLKAMSLLPRVAPGGGNSGNCSSEELFAQSPSEARYEEGSASCLPGPSCYGSTWLTVLDNRKGFCLFACLFLSTMRLFWRQWEVVNISNYSLLFRSAF